jgi:branched-chain amino acid transport system permease protein
MASEVLRPISASAEALLASLGLAGNMAVKIAAWCAFVVLVGLFGQFASRWLVLDVLDIGHAVMAGIALGSGMSLARRRRAAGSVAVAAGSGLAAGLMLAVLVAVARAANLRWMLTSLTPVTLNHVGYDLPDVQAGLLLAVAGSACCALGAWIVLLPPGGRRAMLGALGGVVFTGLLRELIRSLLSGLGGVEVWAFSYDGLLPYGALAAAVIGAIVCVQPGRTRFDALPRRVRIGVTLVCLLVMLALPALTNDFVAQVMMLVCLYSLMGMGLNIELGLAGLVDLGFVAFFAVGAYVVALATSNSPQAIIHINFFSALPLSVLFAACAGFLFGLPVLRVRGDYLAIATLGLGEIIRVLVLSDMLKPMLGGAQGIVNIPHPELFGIVLGTPTRLFYMTAVMAGAAGYCAWRLQHSGLGRRWLAVREDEDVAQALGTNLVLVKLSAYTMGAAFAGLAGGIFAGMVGSVFPQSFQLLISVNVLAILVVGGIGSLPGVIIGAAALIGAPEVLRDLGEYRYLIYGLVIIGVVRLKPEGLSPAVIRHREAA